MYLMLNIKFHANNQELKVELLLLQELSLFTTAEKYISCQFDFLSSIRVFQQTVFALLHDTLASPPIPILIV